MVTLLLLLFPMMWEMENSVCFEAKESAARQKASAQHASQQHTHHIYCN